MRRRPGAQVRHVLAEAGARPREEDGNDTIGGSGLPSPSMKRSGSNSSGAPRSMRVAPMLHATNITRSPFFSRVPSGSVSSAVAALKSSGTDGWRRSTSVSVAFRYGIRVSALKPKPPSASSRSPSRFARAASARSLATTCGLDESSYIVHVRRIAVVSRPARMKLITTSRSAVSSPPVVVMKRERMSVRDATSEELRRSAMIFFDHALTTAIALRSSASYPRASGVLASNRLIFRSGSTKRLPIRLSTCPNAGGEPCAPSSCPPCRPGGRSRRRGNRSARSSRACTARAAARRARQACASTISHSLPTCARKVVVMRAGRRTENSCAAGFRCGSSGHAVGVEDPAAGGRGTPCATAAPSRRTQGPW